MANEVVAILVQEKETKNTIRYREDVAAGAKPIVGQIYLPRHTLKGIATTGEFPEAIRMTVEEYTNTEE